MLIPFPHAFRRRRASTPAAPRKSFRKTRGAELPRLESLEDRNVPSSGPNALATAYGQLPLSFEANQGQTDAQVRFLSRGDGYALYLTPTEAVLSLSKPASSSADRQGPTEPATGTALFMQVVGASPAARVAGEDRLAGTSNYFIGNDPSHWHTAIPTYSRVAYQGVYPGIDLVYYGNQRQLEYDFTVAPGANPGTIHLAFQGADSLSLDGQGDLVLHTAGGDVVEHAPVLYQEGAAGRQAVSGRYVLQGADRVGFEVGVYDPSRPLVIDPVLSYSTYLGGSGAETGAGIAVDATGSAYITGQVGSTDFPTTPGAFQTSYHSTYPTAFVTKLNPTGTGLDYSTYLGGSRSEIGYGIAVDASGSAYITGETTSTDFPTTTGAFQTSNHASAGNDNAFVTKLNPAGTALDYSTYLGGSFGDRSRAIAVDGSGSAYITGQANSTDFPITPGAFQTSYHVSGDAFVTKLNPAGSALDYSTYLGASGYDLAHGIAVDATGSAYITGETSSTDFPTTPGAFQTSYHGFSAAFVTKLNPTGTGLDYSTYLAGSRGEIGYGIAVDASGSAYITGETTSTDFPITPGAFQTSGSAGGAAFVTKFNAAGTALDYSTYLGGFNDVGRGIAVDAAGSAYVTGQVVSTDLPTTPGAFQTSNHAVGGVGNAFLTKFNAAGSALDYSTYLGGSYNDIGFEIALDGSGNAYITGSAGSTDFPTTPGAFQTSQHGLSDAFVAKFTFAQATTHFGVSAPASTTAGMPFTVTVSALDANNNVVTGYTGTVTFSSADPYGASVPADYTFTGADQGVHTFSLGMTLYTAGTWDVTATDTADSTITGSGLVLVNPAAATSFQVSAPANSTAGTPFDLTVTALDPYDNIATAYSGMVHFTSSDPEAVLPADAALVNGSATFSVTLNTTGSQTVTATDTVDSSLTGTATVTVDALPNYIEYGIPTSGSVATGITAGPDGNVWFVESGAAQVGFITPDGHVTEFAVPNAAGGNSSIVTGPDGNLWFTEPDANRIGRITPAGVVTEFPVPTPDSVPEGIAVGPDGNLWFTEAGADQIGQISVAGVVTEFAIPTADSVPTGITLGPDGNLWFTEQGANQIGQITVAGVVTEFSIPTTGSAPTGITAGPDGNLWFTERAANQIGQITVAGVVTEFTIRRSNSAPSGITAAPDGNLWFTQTNSNQLGRITPAGVVTEFPVPTPNSGPLGITVGPDHNLWFTESNVDNIGQYVFGPSPAVGTHGRDHSPALGVPAAPVWLTAAEPVAVVPSEFVPGSLVGNGPVDRVADASAAAGRSSVTRDDSLVGSWLVDPGDSDAYFQWLGENADAGLEGDGSLLGAGELGSPFSGRRGSV